MRKEIQSRKGLRGPDLHILIMPVHEWGSRNDVAIHLRSPDYRELCDSICTAERDLFSLIVIYTNHCTHDSLKLNRLWNRLRKDYVDVRYGTFGQITAHTGEGFKIYFQENGEN